MLRNFVLDDCYFIGNGDWLQKGGRSRLRNQQSPTFYEGIEPSTIAAAGDVKCVAIDGADWDG